LNNSPWRAVATPAKNLTANASAGCFRVEVVVVSPQSPRGSLRCKSPRSPDRPTRECASTLIKKNFRHTSCRRKATNIIACKWALTQSKSRDAARKSIESAGFKAIVKARMTAARVFAFLIHNPARKYLSQCAFFLRRDRPGIVPLLHRIESADLFLGEHWPAPDAGGDAEAARRVRLWNFFMRSPLCGRCRGLPVLSVHGGLAYGGWGVLLLIAAAWGVLTAAYLVRGIVIARRNANLLASPRHFFWVTFGFIRAQFAGDQFSVEFAWIRRRDEFSDGAATTVTGIYGLRLPSLHSIH